MSEHADGSEDLGQFVSSTVIGEIFWAMDHPDDEDGGSSDREPRRPLGSPPALTAEVEPALPPHAG